MPEAPLNVEAKLSFCRDRGQRFIRGQVSAQGSMFCQRCLAPMPVEVESELVLRVLSDEAAVSDYDSSEDLLICDEETLDLLSLVEDEVMLSLPLAPRHEPDHCEAVQPAAAEPSVNERGRDNPFAQLAGLKAALAGGSGDSQDGATKSSDSGSAANAGSSDKTQ